MIEAPILGYPDLNAIYILDTDASNEEKGEGARPKAKIDLDGPSSMIQHS